MHCTLSKQQIILDIANPEFLSHLKECEECNRILNQVNESMMILDEEVTVPEDLYEKILRSTRDIPIERTKSRDFSLVFQFSTVIAAAIVLGIILGFHANTQLLVSKNTKKNEALIEFREMHHLNVERQPLF